MKIRTVTYFCNPGWPLNEKVLRRAGELLTEAVSAFGAAGYEVQTTRIASVPFPHLLGEKQIQQTPKLAEQFAQALQELDIRYGALGPALPETPASYTVIPEALAVSPSVFFSGMMADAKGGIHPQAIRACAEIIVRCATILPDGFANLQFTALANVPAGTPFLPASYHSGEQPAFAIGTEAADLAVEAFAGAKSVQEGQSALIASLQEHAAKLTQVADLLKFRHGARFGGIDFSLAPFPEATRSIGYAIERMGVPQVGLHGSLAAVAILSDALQRADYPHVGFSGVMLPLLEDSTLAERGAGGGLTVKDLLMYSAVCGTGLDTVPIPGDARAGQIAPILLDISALALRLGKPLTARLMPIPGKRAGAPTGFDFAYFANSRVLSLDSQPLGGALGGEERFHLDVRPGNG